MSTRAAIALLCAVLSTPVLSSPVLTASVAEGLSAPALETIASLEARDAIHWTLKTDTGLLVVYADGGVHVFDLLDGGKRIGKPIPLPGAERRGSAVHVSGTNLLLITGAGGGPQEGDAAEAVPTKRSYAINLKSGSVLWNAESFAPPVQTILFPKDGVLVVRCGRQGDEFAAFEVATGRKLWASHLRARYARRNGGVLEVLGEDSGLIDPSSGQRRWAFSLPSAGRHHVLVFPARDRLVVWKENDFKGFAVPAPGIPGTDAELPETVAPRSIWKFEAEDSMPSRCLFMGSCWAQVVSGDRVLIVSKRHAEMLDAATGKVVWTRRKNGVWRAFPVSPSGKTGVEVGWGELVFVDVANGEETFRLDAPAPVGGKERNHTAQWLDENELLVVYYDNAWRPRDMARYDVSGRKILWSHALPKPAKYRLTGKQKGGIARAVIGTLALAAVVVATAPAAYPYQPLYFPCCVPLPVSGPLAANLPRDGSMADEEQDDAVGASAGLGLPEGILALDRRRERWRRIREADSSELFVVSGEDDAYRVLAVDLASGNERSVSEYLHKKVHSMDYDVASRLVISTEDNKRMLRLLAPPERRDAPTPASPPESPSEPGPPGAKAH